MGKVKSKSLIYAEDTRKPCTCVSCLTRGHFGMTLEQLITIIVKKNVNGIEVRDWPGQFGSIVTFSDKDGVGVVFHVKNSDLVKGYLLDE